MAIFIYLHIVRLVIKIVIIFFASTQWYSLCHGQDFNDSLVRTEFKAKIDVMVSEMEMTDTVTTAFYEIYTEYGLYMKEAYENRAGWLRLYEQYKWARRERDDKLKLILDTYQFQCFLQHQNEIESEARKRR